MAVPKKRTGHSAQGHRRSNWKANKPELTTCANCGQPVLTHTVCAACGYYRGKAASIKSPDYVEAADAKKPAKKATKSKAKKEVKEEVVEQVTETETVEQEAVVEEVKEEKPKKSTAKKSTKKKAEEE